MGNTNMGACFSNPLKIQRQAQQQALNDLYRVHTKREEAAKTQITVSIVAFMDGSVEEFEAQVSCTACAATLKREIVRCGIAEHVFPDQCKYQDISSVTLGST